MSLPDIASPRSASPRLAALAGYLLAGILFGIILTKSEAVSWFRIQEMFRFQSFHMYGIIGSAIAVAAVALQIIKRNRIRSLDGELIHVPAKSMGTGRHYAIGGTLFGIGWGLAGACPGPIFALMGTGAWVMAIVLLSATLGTWAYGWMKPHLPH